MSSCQIPPGAWAVGVSGGADSVALLHLLRRQADRDLQKLEPVVIHLNHQTRAGESDEDAEFVARLCADLKIECVIATREQIESRTLDLPANPSAKYRTLRFALFREVVESKKLNGVILAHHADDQAETILQRLLRGTGYSAVTGMKTRSTVNGITVLRPLLHVRRRELREFLTHNQFAWREDSSNAGDAYLRNRIRKCLGDESIEELLALGDACDKLRDFVASHSPKLEAELPCAHLSNLPRIFARRAASTWLRDRGVPADEIQYPVSDRLIEMCADAASASRRQFPGNITVSRRGGTIQSLV